MNIQSASPEFLISSNEFGPIVRTENIITIDNSIDDKDMVKYINLSGYTILFKLKDSNPVYWNYETKEQYISDWKRIRESLNKQIVETDNICECEYYSPFGKKR